MTALPNFLYIGTSKAGSTWLFKVLAWHPEIYMTPSKGLYYFCGHYERGWDWYRDQFHPSPEHAVIGEISHSYLYSTEACRRIREFLPNVKLMVCLREPVERAFSDYLDGVKNGQWEGDFAEQLQHTPSLLDRSRYATHLRPYLEAFPGRIHVGCFQELVDAPDRFAARVFEFLEVEPRELPGRLRGKVQPAGTPRVRAVARLAKVLSHAVGRVGLKQLRGRIKASRFARNLLYRPYTRETRPTIPEELRARLRAQFASEVEDLDRLLGTQFGRTWGYANGTEPAGRAATLPASRRLQPEGGFHHVVASTKRSATH